MSTQQKTPSKLSAGLAGCLAGGVEATAVWPMEYIKTQLQLQAKVAGQAPKYDGMISGLRYTVRTTGFFSLYTGLAPNLIAAFPKAGIRFGANAFFKEKFKNSEGKLSPLRNLAAGMGAGVIEAIAVVTPLETVKTKLISTNMPMVAGVKHIIATEGPGGLYKGLSATILKQASNQGFRFMFFNEYKTWITKDGATKITPIQSLVGGMLAGCFGVIGNNPVDVVKTRMQGLEASRYSSTLDCFAQIIRKEGVTQLWSGAIARMGRVVPGQGIIFMSFEFLSLAVSRYID